MLIVEPEARGLGIGAALVRTCIDFAISAGYEQVTLWTNSILVSARQLYEAFGFQLIESSPNHSFGHELVSETWELDLSNDRRYSEPRTDDVPSAGIVSLERHWSGCVLITRRQLLAYTSAVAATPAAMRNGAQTSAAGRRVIFVAENSSLVFEQTRIGFEAFAGLAGWEGEWIDDKSTDAASVVQAQLDAIATLPAAIALTGLDRASMSTVIERAHAASAYVILFNSSPSDYKAFGVAYAGPDNVAAGVKNGLQAAANAQRLTSRSGGIILLCNSRPGHAGFDQRTEGARQGIEDYNSVNNTSFSAEILTTESDRSIAGATLRSKITQLGDQLIGIAHADHGHPSAASLLEEMGLAGRVANGGFDLVPGVPEAINSGSIKWAIDQNPYAQGWVASALIYSAIERNRQTRSFNTGSEVVDLLNIDARHS